MSSEQASNKKLKEFRHLLDDSLNYIYKITDNDNCKDKRDSVYINDIIISHLLVNAERLTSNTKYSEAFDVYDVILKKYKSLINLRNKLSVKINMGFLYYNLNKFEECRDFLEPLYSEFIKEYDTEHISSLNMELYIANSYFMLHDYKTSLDLYKNLLPRYSKVFGEQFIETLNLKNYLAGCYFESEMYDEAYKLYYKITNIFKTQTSEYSNITVMTKYFSGLCLSFKDKVSKEVIDIYEYIISIKDKFENKEYILKKISFLEMRKYLADYYCFTTHNYDKSLNIYKEILTSNEYKTENYREEYLWIEDRIAYCYMNLGQYENSIDKYRFLLKQLIKTDDDSWMKRFNDNLDFCKSKLKIIYSSLNVKYTQILHDELLNNTNGKEIYRCVSLSSVRLKVLIEKYKKYIGVDKIYNDIKTVLESNYKVLESFRDYK